jgi:hypothetical protein
MLDLIGIKISIKIQILALKIQTIFRGRKKRSKYTTVNRRMHEPIRQIERWEDN